MSVRTRCYSILWISAPLGFRWLRPCIGLLITVSIHLSNRQRPLASLNDIHEHHARAPSSCCAMGSRGSLKVHCVCRSLGQLKLSFINYLWYFIVDGCIFCFVQTAPLMCHSFASVFVGNVNLWSVRTSGEWSQIVFWPLALTLSPLGHDLHLILWHFFCIIPTWKQTFQVCLLVSVDSLDVDTRETVTRVRLRLHLQCSFGKEMLIRRERSSWTDSFFMPRQTE